MVSLRKAFERKQKLAEKVSEVESEFNKAYGDSKYSEIEIPDEVVDCIDYGHASMSWEEFKEAMDEALNESEES